MVSLVTCPGEDSETEVCVHEVWWGVPTGTPMRDGGESGRAEGGPNHGVEAAEAPATDPTGSLEVADPSDTFQI